MNNNLPLPHLVVVCPSSGLNSLYKIWISELIIKLCIIFIVLKGKMYFKQTTIDRGFRLSYLAERGPTVNRRILQTSHRLQISNRE